MSPRFLTCVTLFLMATVTTGADADKPEQQFPAESPEAVVQQYFEHMKQGNWTQVSKLMHPDSLQKFHHMMTEVMEAAEQAEGGKEIADLLGVPSAAEMRATPPDEFFATFMSSVVKKAPQLTEIFRSAEAEILGHLEENETVHVVARFKMGFQDLQMTKMEVISLSPTPEGWRAMLSGQIEGMGKTLARRFGVKPATQPSR